MSTGEFAGVAAALAALFFGLALGFSVAIILANIAARHTSETNERLVAILKDLVDVAVTPRDQQLGRMEIKAPQRPIPQDPLRVSDLDEAQEHDFEVNIPNTAGGMGPN